MANAVKSFAHVKKCNCNILTIVKGSLPAVNAEGKGILAGVSSPVRKLLHWENIWPGFKVSL